MAVEVLFGHGLLGSDELPTIDGNPSANKENMEMTYMNEKCTKDEDKKEGSHPLAARLLESRSVVLSGEINQDLAQATISQMLCVLAHQSEEDIRVFVNSQGGHVDSGFAILDVMRFVKPRVITIALGWVASMGVPIFLGGEKGFRYAFPNTRFMVHQPSQGVLGQASDIEIEAKEILRIRERINNLLAFETGQPLERIEKDSDRNYWMNAEEAVKYGLADKIITLHSDL